MAFLVECEQIGSSDKFIETFHPNGILASKKYYCDNKLKQHFNYNEKGEKHGLYEDYYDNRCYVKKEYKNGKEHGPYEAYHANWKIKYKGEYRDGEVYGISFSYYNNGQVEYRTERDGFKEIRVYQYWESGKLAPIETPGERMEYYDKDGELESIYGRNHYINGGYGGYVDVIWKRNKYV